MLDRDGYRPNVGIIILNHRNQVFWGKRVREHSWQFPQGGIKQGESPEQAMFRELMEEVGLSSQQVEIVGRTREWLKYDVPTNWVRREWRGTYKGQKQIWFFLLRLRGVIPTSVCAGPITPNSTHGAGMITGRHSMPSSSSSVGCMKPRCPSCRGFWTACPRGAGVPDL